MFGEFRITIQKIINKLLKEIIPALLMAFVFIVLAGAALTFYFEKGTNPGIQSFWDALWLTMVTISSVGLGQVVPITVGGRIVSVLLMIFGIALLGTVTTTIVTLIIYGMMREGRGMKPVNAHDHILVCGWNTRGTPTLEELLTEVDPRKTPVVLLADLDVKPFETEDIHFVSGKQANEDDLLRASADKAMVAILLADESTEAEESEVDAKTVLTALTIRALNPDIPMIAEILDTENVSHARRAGVREVLVSSLLMGNLMARSAMHYGMIGVISELMTSRYGDNQVYKIVVGEDLVGKEYAELEASVQRELGYSLLAVESEGKVKTNPTGYKLEQGDKLFIVGESKPTEPLA